MRGTRQAGIAWDAGAIAITACAGMTGCVRQGKREAVWMAHVDQSRMRRIRTTNVRVRAMGLVRVAICRMARIATSTLFVSLASVRVAWAMFATDDFLQMAPIAIAGATPNLIGMAVDVVGTVGTLGSTHVSVRMPLTNGATYSFATAFALPSNTASMTVTQAQCSGTVTIVHN